MLFDEVYLVTDKLETVAQAEIEQLATSLGMTLPQGYAEYMSRLGVGDYCTLLRVYPPERILGEYDGVRQRWDEYFFWEAGKAVLAKEEVLKCVIFADTIDGDEIIAHPEMGDRLFVLPRHDDAIYWVPKGFDAPLEWHGQAGIILSENEFRYFESWRDRVAREFFTAKETFSVADLAPYFSDYWKQMGKHVIQKDDMGNEEEVEDDVVLLFVKEIGARIQLVGSSFDPTSIRIDYDTDSESEVDIFGTFLTDMGFYQTWSPKDK